MLLRLPVVRQRVVVRPCPLLRDLPLMLLVNYVTFLEALAIQVIPKALVEIVPPPG